MGGSRSKVAVNHNCHKPTTNPMEPLRYTLDIHPPPTAPIVNQSVNTYTPSLKIISRSSTLVVMDWDDTLFPTTMAEKVLSRSSSQNPRTFLLVDSAEFKALHQFSHSLYKLLVDLIGCHSSSNLKIVTTSSIGWPSHSLSSFGNIGYFGAVHDLLFVRNDIEVIHPAPSCLPFKSRSDCIRFKIMAFNHLYTESLNRINSMVSIGDDLCEHIAAKHAFDGAMKQNVHCLHRIKLSSKPTLQTMIQQIKVLRALVVEDIFSKLSSRNRGFDICYDFDGKRWI